MPSLYTNVFIDAPRSQVWQILMQKERWKYWNTFLYDCDPNRGFVEGRDVSLSLLRIPGEEIQFRPIVTLIQPEYCLKWISTIPGMRNEHTFELQDTGRDPLKLRGANRTQFIYQQSFSGALTKVVLPFIRQDEQKGMHRMTQELKQYAEKNGMNQNSPHRNQYR